MRFSNKVMVCMLIPIGVAIGATFVGLWDVWSAQRRFESYFENEQAVSDAVLEMYAQGLQGGQAVRNIILDPANRKAYGNLDGALADYDRAAADARKAAARDPVATASLEKIAAARARQREVVGRVVERVKSDQAGAISLLNKEETPAWREVRSRLIDLNKKVGASRQASRAAALAETTEKAVVMLGLAVAALVLAAFFVVVTRRIIRRDLGGEPEDARELMQAVAKGDLRRDVPLRDGDSGSLFFYVETMQRALRQLIGGVRGAVEGINTASSEIATGNADLSARTEQQASSLVQTAASMGQMTDAVRTNADNAKQANQLAASASEVAGRGGEMVGRVVTTMEEITAQSRKISEIINVIDGISFQTNILALNAAVEAARAGEQGRGFAVVASEVRSLAQRSALAAREIKELIGASVEKVENGSKLVGDAGRTMDEIVAQVRRMADLMGEITSATLEQSSGIGQVNQAVSQLDQMTQQNAAMVEQSAAAATSLKEQAQQLARTVEIFKVGDERPRGVVASVRERARSAGQSGAPAAYVAMAA